MSQDEVHALIHVVHFPTPVFLVGDTYGESAVFDLSGIENMWETFILGMPYGRQGGQACDTGWTDDIGVCMKWVKTMEDYKTKKKKS